MDEEHKHVRVPTFDGESCNYQMLWMKFKAHTKVSCFDKALKPTIEEDITENQESAEPLDETNMDDKKKLKTVKRNDNVMEMHRRMKPLRRKNKENRRE